MSSFAVAFDLDHTLAIDNKLERRTALAMLADFAREHGGRYDPLDAERAVDDMLASYRQGRTSEQAAIAGFFERFVPGTGVAVADRAMDFRDRVMAAAPDSIEALPGVHALLGELAARGIPYAILTNGWSPLQEEKARLIGFTGAVYVSERIGVRKPERAAFDVLAKQFEMPLERIWYVGDDPRMDCAGALAHGMTAVWLDAEGVPYPDDVPPPTHRVESLAEIARLLPGRDADAANPAG